MHLISNNASQNLRFLVKEAPDTLCLSGSLFAFRLIKIDIGCKLQSIRK